MYFSLVHNLYTGNIFKTSLKISHLVSRVMNFNSEIDVQFIFITAQDAIETRPMMLIQIINTLKSNLPLSDRPV